MFEIVYLLLERKKVTADELAKHFEVSKRTILRDIEALSIAGIPIFTSKGKGGGISLLENYVLNKTVLSTDEQNQIIFALQSLAATENLDSQHILSKLQALFKKTDTNWIEVNFSRWGNEGIDNKKFELLKQSIIENIAISFTYANSNGHTGRKKVYPLKLLFKSKAWYLQAYCLLNQECRVYKINRMNEIESDNETFSRQNFEIPKIENTSDAFKDTLCLKLLFSKDSTFRVYDEFNASDIKMNNDGSLLVSTQLPDDYWLYSFLLSLGTGVRVLSPQNVKEKLLAQIDGIKKMYLES